MFPNSDHEKRKTKKKRQPLGRIDPKRPTERQKQTTREALRAPPPSRHLPWNPAPAPTATALGGALGDPRGRCGHGLQLRGLSTKLPSTHFLGGLARKKSELLVFTTQMVFPKSDSSAGTQGVSWLTCVDEGHSLKHLSFHAPWSTSISSSGCQCVSGVGCNGEDYLPNPCPICHHVTSVGHVTKMAQVRQLGQ